MKTWLATLGLGLCLSLTGGVASAQGSHREFDRLMRQAAVAYEAHDATAAITALERAYALRPMPRLLFNLGRAHELRGDYATAADYYRRFLATTPDAQSTAVAQEALSIAERNVARAAEEQRQRDAATMEQQRALEAARAQTTLAEQQRLDAEQRRQQTLRGPRRVTTSVAIAWGAAGVAAVTGGVLGGLALASRSDFEDDRAGNARYEASSRGAGLALGADIALGTAVAAGVTGLILFLVQDTTPPATEPSR